MRDDFLLGASKGGQAEDRIQDGEGSGGDVTPPVEGVLAKLAEDVRGGSARSGVLRSPSNSARLASRFQRRVGQSGQCLAQCRLPVEIEQALAASVGGGRRFWQCAMLAAGHNHLKAGACSLNVGHGSSRLV